MGDHLTEVKTSQQARIEYIEHLLVDLKSLAYMLEEGLIENDIVRIGAEQEFCLVDEHWRPAKNALAIIDEAKDEHFTTELAKYNIEINLDPMELTGDAFQKMEEHLYRLINKAKDAARKHGSKVVLTGILPSISRHELGLENMTPAARYYALNDLLKENRGEDFKMHFSGVDELLISHNSVMFEACNTSFQMHLQIAPEEFTSAYNWAQAIAGPVMGICTNSPLLLGKELWSETRIALFQQSIDTRSVSRAQINQQARVSFGDDWIKGDAVDFFRNEISKFRIILTKEIEENSFERLKSGSIPKLKALGLHNGTIYRWNRPCYGVGDGKPHLRIENRYIPAGPTALDEMANFAFWVGIMKGRPKAHDHIHTQMDFKHVKSNFLKASRDGSETVLYWMGKQVPLRELILETFLPMARKGLENMKIHTSDIDKYLSIIQHRAQGISGSEWMVNNYRNLKKHLKKDDALLALTGGIFRNQEQYDTLNEWPELIDFSAYDSRASKVGHIMSTTLITALNTDSTSLTLQFMEWNKVHHLPVIDALGALVGLITWRHIANYKANSEQQNANCCTADIMVKDITCIDASDSIEQAFQVMKEKQYGCLPVLHKNELVGIVTSKDIEVYYNAK